MAVIKLDLRMFGGRGGGSGGAGAGGGGTSNASGGSHGSKGRGSAGGTKHGAAGGSTPQRKSFGEKVTSVRPNESYVLIELDRGKETNPRAANGSAIETLIRKGRLKFSKSRGIWESNTGKRYVVRRR